jgi:hypothetical protein
MHHMSAWTFDDVFRPHTVSIASPSWLDRWNTRHPASDGKRRCGPAFGDDGDGGAGARTREGTRTGASTEE